jgi:hypothetical protein
LVVFFRDLQKAEAAVFYSSVGTLGRAFTDYETDMLGAIKEQPIALPVEVTELTV